jgi:hypothetical protein
MKEKKLSTGFGGNPQEARKRAKPKESPSIEKEKRNARGTRFPSRHKNEAEAGGFIARKEKEKRRAWRKPHDDFFPVKAKFEISQQ